MRQLLGIDLGSRSVKMGIVTEEQMQFYIYNTSLFFSEMGNSSTEGFILDKTKLGIEEDISVFATGYGRHALNIADATVIPEIQAHARGAIEQTGLSDFALIDLGGQDSKIIWIEDSQVTDFYMNDRCAASAGRYVENMAAVIGMDLDEISQYYENPEKLSSTCAVFGESEIVAKLASGVDKKRLAAGINLQIVKKFASKLESRFLDRIVLVGGVAKNSAISRLLSSQFCLPVIIPKFPQFNAVIGLLSREYNNS
ncbi:2-hydroxyglutaryl-CoA dehydratase [bacterium]|nr:2-hydroxyglutaryl-CoA dehydratase [bacterium]